MAVIGAGVVGAAIARRLAEKGVETVLLDRAAPGTGVTAASYALVTANRMLPRAFFDLGQAAMEEYRRLAWRLAPAPWYHLDGSLTWFRDAAAAAELRERVRRLQEWGYAADLVPAHTVLAGIEPGLALPSAETSVAWFPEEAWVDAAAMTRQLAKAVRNAQGRVLAGPAREVVAIGLNKGRVASITLAGGQTIPVAAVVNAAGPSAAHIAALVGRRLPLELRPGVLIRAAMPDGREPLRRPVASDDVALRPDGPGHVVLVPRDDEQITAIAAAPGSPVGPRPLSLDDPVVRHTTASGTGLVPALAAARPVSALFALWPILADGLPSVGAVADIPGYFEAVTDFGVTLAPLIGRLLADEILGNPVDPLLAPFRPDRFGKA